MYCVPYSSLELNNTHSCAIFINVITLFVGIMLIVDYYLEDAAEKAGLTYDTSGRSAVSVIIFVLNLIPLGLPALLAAKRYKVMDKIYASASGDHDILSDDAQLQRFADVRASEQAMQENVGPPTHKEPSMLIGVTGDIVQISSFVPKETQTETPQNMETDMQNVADKNMETDMQNVADMQNVVHQNLPWQAAALNIDDDVYSLQPMYANIYHWDHLDQNIEPPGAQFLFPDDYDIHHSY